VSTVLHHIYSKTVLLQINRQVVHEAYPMAREITENEFFP